MSRRLPTRTRIVLAALALLAVAATLAPLVVPYDPVALGDLRSEIFGPPSLAHPLGTDDLSRDVLSRLLYGARVSLSVAVLSVALSVLLGAGIGMLAGLTPGWSDALLMRTVDAGIAIPRLVLLAAVFSIWDRVTTPVLILILGFTSWFQTARLVRAEVLSLRREGFMVAAEASGTGPLRRATRHLLPNVAPPIIVSAALGVGNIILIEAGLSFLGIGIPIPWPSWGNMIDDGFRYFGSAPWVFLSAGIAVVATVVCFSILGEDLQDRLNPRLHGSLRG